MSHQVSVQPGLMLSSELAPGELQSLSRLAEEVGYGEIWYTDQRFWRDCYTGLALIAGCTEQVRIGPGVNDPFTRHPAMIAMAIATLDEISGGRAQLGMGVGGSGIAEMHLPKVRPVLALREAMELINLMLQGGTVDYTGEIFQLNRGSLGFEPVRPHIPMYVATHGPQVLKLSGKMADGVLLGNMGTREAVDRATGIVRAGEQGASRPAGSVRVNLRLEAIISQHRDEAFAVMRKRVAHRLITSYPNWDFLGDQKHRLDPGLPDAARSRDLDTVQRLLTIADIQSNALVGDPDDVADQLGKLMSPEVDAVTIRPYGNAQQGQEVTIRLFAEHVWPSVISAAAVAGVAAP